MLSDQEYYRIKDHSEAGSFYLMWGQCIPEEFDVDEFSYDENKKIFFEILERLLKDNYLKLHKKGKYLSGLIEEQLTDLSTAFPKTKEEMQDGLWFYFDECPAEPVWLLNDGSLEWS
ncbi:DUF596 domain-containing protein [Limnobaculum xujianqingii]|uniref:DUF596 domain-containing protein n=1 Tax=Limnobaculum xujianqingii TaxID=2738837 RepID=UPI001127E6E6|nr:DUF596 domain-containing protein [Limnobaculum xujianqingii]